MAPVCPKCDVGLIVVHLEEVAVDFCERCRGLWLDAGELAELLARADGRPDEQFLAAVGVDERPGTPTRYLCPRCDRPMNEWQRPSLTLESCPRGHGLWFDAGELPQLLARGPATSCAQKTFDYLNQLLVQPPLGGTH